jgi:hypothetical protein
MDQTQSGMHFVSLPSSQAFFRLAGRQILAVLATIFPRVGLGIEVSQIGP